MCVVLLAPFWGIGLAQCVDLVRGSGQSPCRFGVRWEPVTRRRGASLCVVSCTLWPQGADQARANTDPLSEIRGRPQELSRPELHRDDK
jgi:hypothetical protein